MTETTPNAAWTATYDPDPPTGTITAGSTVSVAIENNYTPTPVEVPLGVKKVMTGSDLPDNASFTFNFAVTAADGTPMPDPATASITVTKNSTGDDLKAAFGSIEYTETGTFTYTVTETMASAYPGVRIVEGTKTVTVKIKDNGGALAIDTITGAESCPTLFNPVDCM